ncbi:MAG: hypothetical protein ACTSRE_06820 [Promethearchaeota archaeon]
MADRKGIGLLLVSVFASASALGIGVYSVVNDSSDSGIVAIWENVSGNGDNFYLIIGDNQFNNSEYFSITDGNTSITLTQIGWYRFTIRLVWYSLVPTDSYYLVLEKNGGLEDALIYVDNPQSSYWTVCAISFVYSDGDDAFKFRCYSSSDSFGIASNQNFNEVVLEYVEEI